MAKQEPKQQPQNKQPAQPDISDSAVAVGGPGQELPSEQAPTAPELVDYKIGDKVVKVAKDALDVLSERERDFDRRMSRQADELKRRFQPVQPTPPQQPPEDPDAYYDVALFEKPREAVKRIKEELKNEVRQEYFQQRRQELFWNGFYRANNDLLRDDDDFIVQAVMQRNWRELVDMETSQAQKVLGDLTRKEILRLSSRMKQNGDETNRAIVEPASSPRSRATQLTEDDGPKTLSEVIAKRRSARAQARTKHAAA